MPGAKSSRPSACIEVPPPDGWHALDTADLPQIGIADLQAAAEDGIVITA
jgi:hypothetical protein